MTVNILFVLIAVAAVLQPTSARRLAALTFILFSVGHDIFLGDTTGLLYYGGAAVADLGALTLIVTLPLRDKIVHCLALVCLASIFLNAVGWLIWYMYLPPVPYDVAFTILYATTLAVLIRSVQRGDGHRTGSFNFRGNGARGDTSPRCAHLPKNENGGKRWSDS